MKNIITLLALISIYSHLLAQDTLQLNLEQCRQMALETNKKLTIASLNKNKAEYGVRMYKANYFPKFSMTGNYLATTAEQSFSLPGGYLPTFVPSADGSLVPNVAIRPDGQVVIGQDGNPVFNQYAYMPDTDLGIKLNNAYTAGLRFEQALYMGGKITAASRIAQLSKEFATINISKTTDEIILETDMAYWQYVQVRELKEVALKYQSVVEELIRNVNDAVEAGMTSKSDLLKAKTQLNDAKLEVLKSENGERLSCMNLCYILGLELTTSLEVVEELEVTINQPVNMGHNISTRPEVEMLNKQLEIMEQKVILSRSEYLPSVGMMGMFGQTGGWTINDKVVSTDPSFSALVSVSIPIFAWSEGRNKINLAKADKQMAEIEKLEAQNLMTLEATKAYNEFQEAFFRVQLTKSALEAADENMAESKNSYQVGMEPLVNYLEAQTIWQKAWAEYIDAKAKFHIGRIFYLKSIGKLR